MIGRIVLMGLLILPLSGCAALAPSHSSLRPQGASVTMLEEDQSREVIRQELLLFYRWLLETGQLLIPVQPQAKRPEIGIPPTTAEIKEHLNKLLESGKKIQRMPAGSPPPVSRPGTGGTGDSQETR